MPQVRMPDGTIVEMPDQLDPALGARLRAFHDAESAPPVQPKGHGPLAPQPAKWSEFNPVEAAGEGLMQAVSGAGAATAGAVGYGLTAAGKALGITDAEPKDVMHNIAGKLTYQPTSKSSQLVERGAKTLFKPAVQKVAELGDEAATAVGKVSPTAETFMREAPAALEAATGVVPLAAAARPVAEAASTARQAVSGATKATQQGDALETMRAAGYKLRPSDVKAIKPGESVAGKFREGLQEPAALRKDLTLENQAVTTKLAAEDLGAPNKKALMAKDYEKLREPHFEVYQNVEKALNLAPSAEFDEALAAAKARTNFKPTDKPTATQVIGALRRQEVKRARSEDVATNREGQLDRDAADSLENTLETRLKAQGDEKLYQQYVDSRRALAKIHDYETATRGGQVDAQAMRRLDKKNPGRMNGNAKIISDAADYAPNVVRHSRGATGVSSSVKADSMIGTVKRVAGKALSKLPGMDVKSTRFQNQYGREATPTERSYFGDYGKRSPKPEPTEPQQVLPGTEAVDFTSTPGVPPAGALGNARLNARESGTRPDDPHALALQPQVSPSTLASELALVPEPVPNAVQLPEAPSMMTADIPPAQRAAPLEFPRRVEQTVPTRDTIDFKASPELMAEQLAGELGLAPRPGDGVPYDLEWMPPNMAAQTAPDLNMLLDLVEQLGLSVETPQPSLMTPVAEPVPYGPRVQLERPPGRVGKLRKPKK